MAGILISGSRGLIGSALRAALESAGHETIGIDLRGRPEAADDGDIRDVALLGRRLDDCAGIVHLAAVSRVVWAQRRPALCWETNVTATHRLLDAAAAAGRRPWILFASSCQVYGEPDRLPVDEDSPLRPVNIFGRSKAEGERIVLAAREAGLTTAIVRFAHLYGSTADHLDRVVPAFARAAALGGTLRVCGSDTMLDLTHVDDAVRGIVAVIEQLAADTRTLLPVHLVTGRGTTLGELAGLANAAAGRRARILEAPPRSYDVARFVGDPSRARALLGWQARIDIAAGVARLVRDFAIEAGAAEEIPPAVLQRTSSPA